MCERHLWIIAFVNKSETRTSLLLYIWANELFALKLKHFSPSEKFYRLFLPYFKNWYSLFYLIFEISIKVQCLARKIKTTKSKHRNCLQYWWWEDPPRYSSASLQMKDTRMQRQQKESKNLHMRIQICLIKKTIWVEEGLFSCCFFFVFYYCCLFAI